MWPQSVSNLPNFELNCYYIRTDWRTAKYGEATSNTGCGRNNSHISKNHCGVPKAVSGVWSVPLGRVHKKPWSGEHRGFVVAAF
jgi:hypothetical protein